MVLGLESGPVLVQKLLAIGNIGLVQGAKAPKHAIRRCFLGLMMMGALVPDDAVATSCLPPSR